MGSRPDLQTLPKLYYGEKKSFALGFIHQHTLYVGFRVRVKVLRLGLGLGNRLN